MATSTSNLTWLPADLQGLPAIPTAGMLYIYKEDTKKGVKQMLAMVSSKSRFVIRFPEGSTIETIPANSVGTDQIIDQSVELEDINPDVFATKSDIDEMFDS